ncbi:MAG: hypothetical protein WDM89_03490 [Rhizomicrobium sp.]
MLGSPGDNTALTSQLTNVSTALGQSVMSPTDPATQLGTLSAFQSLATQISSLSNSVQGLRTQADQQIAGAVTQVNTLLKQIHDLNTQAAQATAAGDTGSAVFDQRDLAVQSLSQLIGIRTQAQSDGTLAISTTDGVGPRRRDPTRSSTTPRAPRTALTARSRCRASIRTRVRPSVRRKCSTPISTPARSRGLMDMRDGSLAGTAEELGNLARTTALAYNAQHNANTSYPPPPVMNGRDTGLLSTDSLNFTGKTTIAVADSSGNLVSRVDVDFDAGTISVDGGTATSFTNTVGGFTAALNGALGSNGAASFTNGQLSISANNGNGVVIKDDATTPSSRGGSGFSQFFGMNDVFRTSQPSILSTGLFASDDSGLAAGGQMTFALKGADGSVVKQAAVNITAGMSIGDVVNAMNTAMSGRSPSRSTATARSPRRRPIPPTVWRSHPTRRNAARPA